MANIVSIIMQYLTPDMIARISSALGLDRGSTQTAIGASVPALLAAIGNVATQPGGAQKLADQANQQSGMLDSLTSMIGGQSEIADKGSRMLSSLLGGSQQNMLTGAITNFTGIGQGASNSLLGMLAPLIMGVIGKQLGSGGIDSYGVANLLAGQKDNIAAALPAGMRDQLRGTGLLDSLQSTAGTAAGQASRAGRAAVDTGYRAARATPSSSMNWLYWALPAAAVVALLFYVFNRPEERVAEQPRPAATTTGSGTASNAPPSMVVAGLDVGKEVNDSLANLKTSLQGVNDVASATAAQPKLEQVKTQLDKVSGVSGQLSADQRKMLSTYITPSMPMLNQMFDSVLAVPGVASVLKPHIDMIKEKLTTLTIVT